MKKLIAAAALLTLVAAPAIAADMPVATKAPPRVMPVAVYSWTGCYIGIEGGGAWGRSRHISGDVGTAGGLVTDEFARVCRADGSIIPGLYATGNSTASVFGRCYPGAGASIAASFIFGYIAAIHASRSSQGQSPVPQEHAG